MGLCSSKSSYISSSAGGERDYQERFLESKTLGQGEFGVVKLVHDVKNKDLIGSKPLAVKYLKKGYTFKDNTLYTPLKKEVLQGEVEILRRLNGECYNLKLVAVYESPSMIYMVTEYCEGGEMMPWVSNAFKDGTNGGMRTEDVSRICFQLWSAVDHCARHRVIHRDIKPGESLFTSLSTQNCPYLVSIIFIFYSHAFLHPHKILYILLCLCRKYNVFYFRERCSIASH